ncbi:DUF4167 domain-containing protein [Tsuneonella amylolytica]|uniref:DUF4167 domain-containing protein n=1 Tax=Tsuneonella amylolytica TaxID=2338327 RepID=UPI000EA8E100|nr:DUF4167 domain-containing protein [Tsuneonella amylolytica]
MNNNRNNNNNRRRGRGNRNQGGGNQNRIDSRARGNAPQMLDKYKKLAQDAAHHGDRVQAEYYLQFADHYFRVLADNKARQDEARGGNRNERDDDDGDEVEDEFDGGRQRQGRQNDRSGDRGNDRSNDRGGDRPARGDRDNDGRRQRGNRGGSPDGRDVRGQDDEIGADDAGSSDYEPADNPFTRGSRKRDADAGTGDAPKRKPRARRSAADDTVSAVEGGEIDIAVLPPSFSATGDEGERVTEGEIGDEGAAPKRKLPPRRRRKADDEGEPLKAAG